jgi:hypothetical protein
MFFQRYGEAGLLYHRTIPDSTPRMAESRMGEEEA